MINIIEFINKENLTLASVEALRKSNIIISYSKDFEDLVDFIDLSAEIFFIDSFEEEVDLSDLTKLADLNIKACELAISKSFNGKNVSLISNEVSKFGFNNLIYQLISKYSQEAEIKIYPTVSATNYSSSIVGAPLDDFSAINFANYLIPQSELENKIKSSLKANFILAIYNPISNIKLFNKFKEIASEILSKNTIIAIIDLENNSKEIINLDTLDESKINESSFLIVGNKVTYKENDLMITPHSYVIRNEIISYTREFFEKYLNDESPRGFNHDCEYLPCHSDMEACDFCYCPFYPCGESSTGGKWIKDKNVWDCVGCTWIHKLKVDNCIREGISDILNEVEDLNIKKEELLRVRRECILKTK